VARRLDPIAKLDALIASGPPSTKAFQTFVLSYFKKHGRDFPWRRTKDPYKILVSEVMLQQTQTERVAKKYAEFLAEFPSWQTLAEAPPAAVVRAWMGLGYYRRAFNLHKAAQAVCNEFGGRPPRTAEALRKLPGVGSYTAAAVATFSFGEVVPMIETNIRSVYLYVFYPGSEGVTDAEIGLKIAETMWSRDSRSWFYALMDLGVELKRCTKGINQRSRHHVKQSRFHGSQREARAAVLKLLVARSGMKGAEILSELSLDAKKVERAIADLETEGLITKGRSGRLTIVG